MRLTIVPVCVLGAAMFIIATTAAPTPPSDLKPDTVVGFDRYARVTEARMQADLNNHGFLVIDRLPASRHRETCDRIRNGEIYLQRLHTLEDGHSIEIPGGLIHHWVAVIFVPGKTLSQAVAVLQDYDIHQDIYKPEVRRSQLLEGAGDGAKVYFEFYEKTVVTVVFNANFDVSYDHPDTTRFESTSRSTRIAEVENVGKKNETELPVGHDEGFLWRMNTYWRVEERDGGVYLQCEWIVLTRRVPAIAAWLVNPLMESIPRAFLSKLLFGTRDGMANRQEGPSFTHNAPRAKPQSIEALQSELGYTNSLVAPDEDAIPFCGFVRSTSRRA